MKLPPPFNCTCGWRHWGVCPNPLHWPAPRRVSSRGLALEVLRPEPTDLERIPDGDSEAAAA